MPLAFDQIRFTTRCATEDDVDCVRDPGGLVTSYRWGFGDGSTATGPEVTHLYDRAGTFVVTLTVGDDFNRVAQVTGSITIGGTTGPTVAFEFSPTMPVEGERVFFNASGSAPAIGRVIDDYEWDFGDGETEVGLAVSHPYEAPGSYVVVLRVTDDAGQTGTASRTVTVSSAGPTADFVFSPTAPTVIATVLFDASSSQAGKGRTITGYSWSFRDGAESSAGPQTSHPFAAAGTFAVRLTVTDDQGDTQTVTKEVTVLP